MRVNLCFEKPRFDSFEAKDCKMTVLSFGLIRFFFYNKAFKTREAELFRRIMYQDEWYAGHSEKIRKEVEEQSNKRVEFKVGQIQKKNKELRGRLDKSEKENQYFRSLEHFIKECNRILTEK